ncbi:MAG TPA: hypothetical protein VG407_01975 [Caulobacteraceae bacterium]|jgi:hypothetical protein|nr:hypothetical protein [Caulobacteraceae bacterium]
MLPVRRAVITLYINPDARREEPGHELTPEELRDVALVVNDDAEFIFGYESCHAEFKDIEPTNTPQGPA